MKKQIEDREDLQLLLERFYDQVKQDAVIGYLFNDVAKVDWDKHLPLIVSFWEQVIFHTGDYRGNPMLAHKKLHQLSPLKPEHFDRWLELFLHTLDGLFEGQNAELARQRAMSIATMMRIKVLHDGIPVA